MPTYLQANRPLSVTTPLGEDKLLLVGLRGQEALSTLFRYEFELLAENTTQSQFDKLLGQKGTAAIKSRRSRKPVHLRHSSAASARDRAIETFTGLPCGSGAAVLVSHPRGRQSRIFQHMSVPDILKQVLAGLDVTYEIQGTFEQREYCVQYRETDFDFASRLMEEEGIYYFFKHTDGGHKMVLANTPQSHPDLPPGSCDHMRSSNGGESARGASSSTGKRRRNCGPANPLSGTTTFELPDKHLEADKTIVETVQAGKVSHKLKVGSNDKLELYDYPGGYAQRFDGIDSGRRGQPGTVAEDLRGQQAHRRDPHAAGSGARALAIAAQRNCPAIDRGLSNSR